VRVPFPYVERERREVRPAVVVSSSLLGGEAGLFWSVMITSAANSGWPDDLSLEDRFTECGLKVPCVIRTAKIASLEASRAEKVGRLPQDLLAVLQARLASHLGL
jgi:mRNA interferase MazF